MKTIKLKNGKEEAEPCSRQQPFNITLKLIGGRIRKLRFAKGETMKVAYFIRAEYGVKLDPSYLSRIERGKTEIPLRTLLAISHYYGIKPGALLDGDQEGVTLPKTDCKRCMNNLTRDAGELRKNTGE